ncbi:MAG: permease prefix domain 1-containing protein [Armatimonadetes bacterium]|nr:permease prefix domain 1-containing protein [Armatimonadota bacterium]
MNSPLETYLDELSEQLQALPIHERLEQVDETRAHLESLILPFEEGGSSREEAEAQAIAQFGEVSAIAPQLNRMALRKRWLHLSGVAAIYWGAQLFCLMLLETVATFLTLDGTHPYLSLFGKVFYTQAVFTLLDQVLAFFVSGALLRRLSPGNTLLPLLLVSATLLTFSLVSELQYRLQFYLALEYGILTKRSFAPAPSHYPWAILFSFITSGALQEGHSIGWRRRLV